MAFLSASDVTNLFFAQMYEVDFLSFITTESKCSFMDELLTCYALFVNNKFSTHTKHLSQTNTHFYVSPEQVF